MGVSEVVEADPGQGGLRNRPFDAWDSEWGVTKIIDRLVGAGLVERIPSESDRRVIYARLTETAKKKVRDNQHIFDGIAKRRLGELLTSSEMESLAHMVDRLSCANPGWEPPDLAEHRTG